MEQQTKTVIFQLYIYILYTDTVKQTISWNNKSDHWDRKTKNKNIGIAI